MAAPTSPNAAFDARSGQGPASVIPDEIKRWSWGAFLLTFIWGIGNRVWMSLLVFVPVVNVAAPFILGAKGNELAWREKQWESVEAFQKTQRKWAIAGLIVLGASLAISIGGIVLVLLFGKPVELESDSKTTTWEQNLQESTDSEMMEDEEWVTYSSWEDDFEASFPYEPDLESGSYEADDGEYILTSIVRASEGTTVYFVARETGENPLPTTESEIVEKLQAALKVAERSIEGASIIQSESAVLNGMPALKYTMMIGLDRMEDGFYVLKGAHVYAVAAEYDFGQKPPEVDTFHSSFMLKELPL